MMWNGQCCRRWRWQYKDICMFDLM